MVCMRVCVHINTHSLVLTSEFSEEGGRHWPCTDFELPQADKGTLLRLHCAMTVDWTDFLLNWLIQLGVLASYRHDLRVHSLGLSRTV